jgi:drug/metabolite transporter (DMT)-like permease
MEKQKVYSLMVLATLCWSGAFIAGKYSISYIPVFTMTFIRLFIAAVIMYFVMKIMHYPYRLQKHHIPVFLLTGTIGMFGYHILFFFCLNYTSAINSSIIGAMNPIVTVILAYVFLKQRLNYKQVFGVILSFVGVFLTITGADPEVMKGMTFNKGDLIMLCAVLCWASYGIISSRAIQADQQSPAYIPPIPMIYYSFIVGIIVLIPFVVWEPQHFITELPSGVWISIIYMSIFPSAIGYLLQQISIREIGPSRTSIFINLVPVFSIILAVIILSEKLEPVKLLTAALIITGVIITQKERVK